MKNHNRTYNLLAAGSLTALLFLTFWLFRGNQFGTAIAANESTTTPAPSLVVTGGNSLQAESDSQTIAAQAQELATLRAQNAKLVQMIQVMQEREQQYQRQLDEANQALQAAQAQVGARHSERWERGHDD